ncbi:MAG: DUF4870 domain-containing protein [Dehalococcoidia bacterium]|nr:DUF4870 domain-containing protein [Dehalococcoidia bacterium]
MAECSGCRAEIASFDRRCWQCGAGIKRDVGKLFAGAPTDKELSQARLCHLLALPGMLVLGILSYVALGMFGLLGLVPLNLIIPFAYWLLHSESRFVRGHAAEALNFQLLWTLAVYAVWFIPLGGGVVNGYLWMFLHAVVLAGGVALVWIASLDAESAGNGRYPVRLPLFH